MKTIVILFTILFTPLVFANQAEETLRSHEPVRIGKGFIENAGLQPIPLTQDQKLKNFRRRLELRNEAMVKRSIELIRLQNEVKLMKRMNKALNEAAKKPDTI
jgi:hypothetical protein